MCVIAATPHQLPETIKVPIFGTVKVPDIR